MAAAYRSSGSATTGATPATDITLTMPAGVQPNDALLVLVATDGGSGATITPPSGWTQLRNTTQSTNLRAVVYWRLARAQEPASYTWTFDTTRAASATIVAYSGVHPFLPPQSNPVTTGTASTTISAATVNSSYAGIVVQLTAAHNTSAASTITPASTFTEREDTCTTASAFINVALSEAAKGFTMGGTLGNSLGCSQTATAISTAVFIEDARPAFGVLGEDTFTVGSLTASVGNTNAFPVQTNYPNELLLLFFTIAKDAATISSVTGAGLTWVLVARANTNAGSTELWRAFAPTPINNQTVSITYSSNIVSGNMMFVGIVGADITGANGSGAIGAVATGSSTGAAASVSLTTTRNNSWVWSAGNVAGVTGSVVSGSNQTTLRAFSDATNTAMGWMNRQNTLTPASGTSVTMNVTQPSTGNSNILAVEVLPAVVKNLGSMGVG